MRQEPECKIGMVGASGGVTTLATDIVSGMWDTWVHLTLPHGRGWGGNVIIAPPFKISNIGRHSP